MRFSKNTFSTLRIFWIIFNRKSMKFARIICDVISSKRFFFNFPIVTSCFISYCCHRVAVFFIPSVVSFEILVQNEHFDSIFWNISSLYRKKEKNVILHSHSHVDVIRLRKKKGIKKKGSEKKPVWISRLL